MANHSIWILFVCVWFKTKGADALKVNPVTTPLGAAALTD